MTGVQTCALPISKSGDGSNTLFLLDVDRCKDMLFRRLRITQPGPGMIHFPMVQPDGLDDEYLQQFENEKKIERHDRFGKPVRHYAQKGNVEAVDLTNYCYGALLALGDAVINELPRLVTQVQERGRELRQIVAGGGTVPSPVALPAGTPQLRGPRLHSKRDW